LRHGIPFQAWDLPNVIRVVRDRRLTLPKGDRTFVERLLLARELGREVLEVACELTLETGVISAPTPGADWPRPRAPPRLRVRLPRRGAWSRWPMAHVTTSLREVRDGR
jgi:hypothetical protein